MIRHPSTMQHPGADADPAGAPASAAGLAAWPDRTNPKVRQLLEAAHALFLDQPYDTVSTDAIVKEAKVSKATLYAYFPSKEALFAALVSDKCGQTAQAIWESASASDDVEEVLRTIAQNFMAMFATGDALAFYRSIIAQVPRFPELGRIFYESGPKVLQERIESFLRDASERGDMAIPDPKLAAMQFLQLISVDVPLIGLLGLEPLTKQRADIAIESGVALFMAGYGARPRTR
ncbi:TetR/AcrR family transcriptional regulator [Starkeya sp. ORNL1]|uniref:TetR/AcrR family transcriptional regulator n=1 Tax=Starkeya sp. ORNL1 TaxID=2709380 RepID=UPI001463A512|nr:TetR/AcrR family transcriptional regulator [Starkeya sp. ORNL1]QJP16688.1 TetR/AcrR family transcriptional regulator [Starkeya sp. ORNL1]